MRLPLHLRKNRGSPGLIHAIKKILRENGVSTVCEEARCPNIGECFAEPTATFLLLGDVCTRRCTFCAVAKGVPLPPDPGEPGRVAEAARRLGLSHVVLTSVTRDDLPDGGAGHFAVTVREIRRMLPHAGIEVLTPDFRGALDETDRIIREGVDIFNHNLETVPRLYPRVRPQADYKRSMRLIDYVKRGGAPRPITAKSGLMLGLGEETEEVIHVMRDLRSAGCDIITIGHYLRPGRGQKGIHRHVRPDEFDDYRAMGKEMGFAVVLSGPLVRSSYHARETIPGK